jgi:hypothetical protein
MSPSSENTQLRQQIEQLQETIGDLRERVASLECRFALSVEPRHIQFLEWQKEVKSDHRKLWGAGWGVAASLAALVLELARRLWLH